MKWMSLVLGVAAIICGGCVQYGVPPNVVYYFKSKNAFRATERDALEGDNAAARRMADYYYFVKNDRGACMWWFKLAALRGDSIANENLKRLQHG
jgi:hypothetical protein